MHKIYSSKPQGPTLAEVLAFTMLEDEEDVARVERAARHRLSRKSGWTAWRVFAAEIEDEADELCRIKIYAENVRESSRTGFFEFLTDYEGKRHSERLDAFLQACGIRERCDEVREIEGRFFATRYGGRSPDDFAALSVVVR